VAHTFLVLFSFLIVQQWPENGADEVGLAIGQSKEKRRNAFPDHFFVMVRPLRGKAFPFLFSSHRLANRSLFF
jgi:hypothetical protein